MLKPTIADVVLATAMHFELRVEDIRGPSRARYYARPRQIAMYLAYIWGTGPLSKIGRHVGYRDHTTVLHAIRTISQLLLLDHAISEAIADIHIITARMVRTRDEKDLLEAVA